MKRKLPIVCASVDVFISIMIVITIAVFDGKATMDSVTKYRGLFIIALIISLVAGWRGYIDSNKILAGDRNWLRPARDGFIVGFIPVPVSHVFGIFQEAFAAGPPWPTIGYSSITDWLKYIIWMLGGAILFGSIGAVYGLSLSALNRFIIRISQPKEQRRINHMERINSLELKIPPVAVFFIFAALMWLVARVVSFAGIALPAKNPIAAGIAAMGGVIAGAGILSLLRARTTLNPFEPGKSASLVTTGIYAVSRNPMYLSLLFVLIGWAVYLSNPATLVVIPFFVAYMNRFQIIPEERALSSLFGGEFEAYCKRVRRWF